MPRDWLTRLRWIILGTLLVGVIGLVPVLVYNVTRLMGTDSETLRSIASIAGNLSRFAGMVLLLMIFEYRRKD